jgi:hypothetical protein
MNEFDGSDRESPVAGLAKEIAPPDHARRRIIGALAERGLLRQGPRAGSRIWRAAAILGAAAALFAAGLLAGRREGPSAPTRGGPPPEASALPRFVLFLSRLPGETEAGEPERVAEYKSWAAGLRGQGRLISGEKLRPEARLLGAGTDAPPSGAAQEVSGFFVLEARDLDAALALARTCPHLRHGGRITVRQIAPV